MSDVEAKVRGRVKWYNEEKGYGFLTPSEGGGDVFFHISEVLGDYEVLINDEVRYVVRTDRKNGKPEAVLIDVLGDNTEAKPDPSPWRHRHQQQQRWLKSRSQRSERRHEH